MKRDLATNLSEETERVGARIDKSYEKLALKLRRRADWRPGTLDSRMK